MNAADPIDAMKSVEIEPLTLVCRVCKASMPATNTIQVMRHIIESHPNAMIAANAAFGLLSSACLFEAPDNPERWKRNQAAFQAEGEKAILTMLANGIPTIEDFIASGGHVLTQAMGVEQPPSINPEPLRPPRHRNRAGHNRSKPPGANETGY